MAEPARVFRKAEFFSGLRQADVTNRDNEVYISPPNQIVVKTGTEGSQTTESVQYVTLHDPATNETLIYEKTYVLGSQQKLDPDKLIATRNADGTYEPSAYASGDDFNSNIADAIINNPDTLSSLEAQRKYTIQSALEVKNGKTPTAAELATALGTTTEEEADEVDEDDLDRRTGGDDDDNTSDDDNDGSVTPQQQPNDLSGTNGSIVGNTSSQAELTSDVVYPTARAESMTSDYIRFSSLEYKPRTYSQGTFSFGSAKNQKIGKSVYLPIQGSITDSNGVGWNEDTITPLQIAGAEIAGTAVQDGPAEAINALQGQLGKVSGFSAEAQKYVVKAATEAAIGANIFPRTERAIFNPNVELLFNGPQLRAFTFQFKLTPRSADEDRNVKQIIKFFKINMSAKTTQSELFLKAPNVFRIEYLYRDGAHPGINLIKDCALQNFSVDYTPDGTYMTLPNGGMFSYALTMSFMELLPIYSTDYDEGEAANHPIGY